MKKLICSLMVGLMSFSSAVSIVGAIEFFDFSSKCFCMQTPVKGKNTGKPKDRIEGMRQYDRIEIAYVGGSQDTVDLSNSTSEEMV